MIKEKISLTQKALNLWGGILIVWALYRTYFFMPVWFDEFIAKPIVFVLPVFYFLKKVDKKPILSSLFFHFQPKIILKDLFNSLVIGSVFLLSAVLAFYFKNQKFVLVSNFPGFDQLFFILLTSLVTGFSEEVLSRGFILKKLYDESKNIFTSTLFASFLFFFLHIPILFSNPKITGSLLLIFMTTDMLLSIINGLIFLERKSLLGPIFIHAFYNFVIALVYLK